MDTRIDPIELLGLEQADAHVLRNAGGVVSDDALRSLVPGLDHRQAERRVVASLSAIFFPALFAGLYRGLGTLTNASERREYAAELARRALAPASSREEAT